MSGPRGFVRGWFRFTLLLWDVLVSLYLAGMAWLFLSRPSVTIVYGLLLGVMTLIAYVMWRVRRARARRASRKLRERLDLTAP